MKKLTCILAVMLMLCLCTVAYAADPVTLDITALDYQTGKAILKLLQDTCRDTGRTVVVVTHNSAFTAIADRVIHVREGSVAAMELNEAPLSADVLEW